MNRLVVLGGLMMVFGVAIGLGLFHDAPPTLPSWFIPVGLAVAVVLAFRKPAADRSAILITAAVMGVILIGVATKIAALTSCIGGAVIVAIGSQAKNRRKPRQYSWVLWIVAVGVVLLILFAI
jgi:hypothetical protein